MQLRKSRESLSILEAVDQLSQMAELDKTPFTEKGALLWQDPAYHNYHREQVKEAFQAVLSYLQAIYEKEQDELREKDVQTGIQALVVLAREAAEKIDKHTTLFSKESVTELKEYKELYHFYQTKIAQRFHLSPLPEKWPAEEKGAEGGIADLEAVRRDHAYELFLLSRPDGQPLFTTTLLYHLELVGQFEHLLASSLEEELFHPLEKIENKEAHASAKEILRMMAPHIDAYLKEASKHKEKKLVSALNKTLMALRLASNTPSLMESMTGKTAREYYTDFYVYLREAYACTEYQQWLKQKEGQEGSFLHLLTHLMHLLSSAFFLRSGSPKERRDFIRKLIDQKSSSSALAERLLVADRNLRHFLKQFPSGPLLKTLQLFEEEEQLRGFDPIKQGNWPLQLYTLASQERHITCLKLPSPTVQKRIDDVHVTFPFLGFLSVLEAEGKRHLLIDLQDHASPMEHPRSLALQALKRKKGPLCLISLPKHTDFYRQTGAYLELNEAHAFIHEFKKEIKNAEEGRFSLFSGEELSAFTSQALEMIHTLFFGKQDILSQQNRLDFIELFYFFLTLKCIETIHPDSVSFTCKDGLDTGSAVSAQMFAFLLLLGSSSREERIDDLLAILYLPALEVRGRAMDAEGFSRLVSSVEVMEKALTGRRAEILASCAKLYDPTFFESLKLV